MREPWPAGRLWTPRRSPAQIQRKFTTSVRCHHILVRIMSWLTRSQRGFLDSVQSIDPTHRMHIWHLFRCQEHACVVVQCACSSKGKASREFSSACMSWHDSERSELARPCAACDPVPPGSGRICHCGYRPHVFIGAPCTACVSCVLNCAGNGEWQLPKESKSIPCPLTGEEFMKIPHTQPDGVPVLRR